MREKIRVDRLAVGMYVESLCARWIDHPFWRTSFLVRDRSELAALRASGIAECWIDRSRGVAPAAAQPAGVATASATAAAPTAAATGGTDSRDAGSPGSVARGARARVRFDEEIAHAAAVCTQAARATQSLFREARLGRAIEVGRCAEISQRIAESATRHPSALASLARVRTHHSYTFLHSVAVCALMSSLAAHLGLDEAATRDAALAGLLHDIGKAGIARETLDKPGSLTDAEYALVKTHPGIGRRMLLGNLVTNDTVLHACLHHHERFDGNGYPEGLAGEAIPYAARLNSVCDVYDAITSVRAYKEAWDPAEAIVRMAAWTKAGQFDPSVFRAFVDMVGIYPVGSLVRLQSERLALVTDQNPQRPAQPFVKVFWSTRKSIPLRVCGLDLSAPAVGDRIVARESNAKWGFAHLPELLLGEEIHRRFAAAA
ncbi:MAG: HD-GYP domain-containing protein [Burkholderiaceae bacterium]|nr:HD-GYP domain-containing protein [Burkholderiaceae bacterium]